MIAMLIYFAIDTKTKELKDKTKELKESSETKLGRQQ
jgi:hypothetical protein